MDFVTYEKEVEKVALYPHSGEQNMISTIYPGFGLTGESGEVADKIADLLVAMTPLDTCSAREREDLLYEIGDVLWYIARVLYEIGHSITEIESYKQDLVPNNIEIHALRICAASGRINEHMKKSLRDDEVSFSDKLLLARKELIFKEVASLYSHLCVFVYLLGYTIYEAADKNIEKLNKRKSNNSIKGEGDHR